MEVIIEEEDSHSAGTTIEYVSDSLDENANQNRTTKKTSDWQLIKPLSRDGLYYRIFHTSNIESVVRYWTDNYEINCELAIHELLQFFVDMSNYQNFNVADFMENNELEDIVNNLEDWPNSTYKESGKYLLKLRSKMYVRYHKIIEEFIINLILNCEKNEILYDHCMIPFSTKLLQLMSTSKYRSIRHTAVFITLKYITALIKIIKMLYEESLHVKKAIQKKQETGEDLQELEIKSTDVKHYYKIVNKYVHYLYENIFRKNWNLRDNALSIMRQDCILEIRQWIKCLPEKFLNNDAIPITLQAVTDDSKIVRYNAMEVLMSILDNEEFQQNEQIKANIKKYAVVIGKRMADKDLRNGAFAIDLLSIIDKHHKPLSQDLGDRVLINIYGKYPVLATAAGRFLVQKLQRNHQSDIDLLYGLVKYQIYSEDKHKTGDARRPLLVESVFNYLPVLQDVDSYVHVFQHTELNPLETYVLIDIFCESLLILLTGHSSLGRDTSFKQFMDAEKVKAIFSKVLAEIKVFSQKFPTEKFKVLLSLVKNAQNKDISTEQA